MTIYGSGFTSQEVTVYLGYASVSHARPTNATTITVTLPPLEQQSNDYSPPLIDPELLQLQQVASPVPNIVTSLSIPISVYVLDESGMSNLASSTVFFTSYDE